LDAILGMMHLVWAGGGLQAVARVVLAEARLMVIKLGVAVRRSSGRARCDE
jgi:prefoldin subunit 5